MAKTKTKKPAKAVKMFDYRDFDQNWLPTSPNRDSGRGSSFKVLRDVKKDPRGSIRKGYYGK